jgi:hypothetical protein
MNKQYLDKVEEVLSTHKLSDLRDIESTLEAYTNVSIETRAVLWLVKRKIALLTGWFKW